MVHKCGHKVAEAQPIKQQKQVQLTLPLQLAQQVARAQEASAVPVPSEPAQLQPQLTPQCQRPQWQPVQPVQPQPTPVPALPALPTPANALAAGLATPIGETPPPMPGPEPGPVLATHSLAGMQPVQEPDAATPGADSPAEVVVEKSPQGDDVAEISPDAPEQFLTPERPQLRTLQMTPERKPQPTPTPVVVDDKACLICEERLDSKPSEALTCGHATWLHHLHFRSFPQVWVLK